VARRKGAPTAAQRKKMSGANFALPGKRKYWIPDKRHGQNALARVAQHGTPQEKRQVKAAVRRRFPSINVSK
jgi:hypothetical protein